MKVALATAFFLGVLVLICDKYRFTSKLSKIGDIFEITVDILKVEGSFFGKMYLII